MNGELLRREDGRAYGFLTTGVGFQRLCKSIALYPGVSFIGRRFFFWSSEDIEACFSFKEHTFKIDTNSWDDTLMVEPSDDKVTFPEIQDVFYFVKKRLRLGEGHDGA